MYSFKELVQADVKSVFLNLEEFGDTHTIDGKSVTVIVDNNEHLEREKRVTKSNMEGVFKKQLLFYVSSSDMNGLPAIGRLMLFDGKDYQVIDAIDENGIYSITLEANRN